VRKAAVIPFNENKESASQETNGPPLKRKRPLSLQRRLLNRLDWSEFLIVSASPPGSKQKQLESW